MDKNKLVYKYIYMISMILCLIAVVILYAYKTNEVKRPSNIPLGDYSYSIEYVNDRIDQLMNKHKLPSVVVALIDGDDVIFKSAYGYSDLERKTPATLDTIYKMGSITKLFTGIEIMRMYDEGLIDIDDPIDKYLEDFYINTDFDSNPITIKSLLSHRSGLPRGSSLLSWYWESSPNVLKLQTQSLAESYLAFPVDYRYKYSNIGYNVLARIIEVVRKIEPPSELAVSGWLYYMKSNILFPLEMNNTDFASEMLLYGKLSSQNIAMGYYNENGRNIPLNQFDIINLGSGNMQSTMNDMIKFSKYILNIEKSDTGGIISGEALWSMYEPQNSKTTDPQTNGLSWFTDRELLDELVVFHSGTNQGFISLVALMPEKKLGFIVFSNSDEFEDVQIELAIDMLKLMHETKYGMKSKLEDFETEIEIDKSSLLEYTGKYVINGEIIEIILSGDKLKAVYKNKKIKMIPITKQNSS